jgi:hypothetical protein
MTSRGPHSETKRENTGMSLKRTVALSKSSGTTASLFRNCPMTNLEKECTHEDQIVYVRTQRRETLAAFHSTGHSTAFFLPISQLISQLHPLLSSARALATDKAAAQRRFF